MTPNDIYSLIAAIGGTVAAFAGTANFLIQRKAHSRKKPIFEIRRDGGMGDVSTYQVIVRNPGPVTVDIVQATWHGPGGFVFHDDPPLKTMDIGESVQPSGARRVRRLAKPDTVPTDVAGFRFAATFAGGPGHMSISWRWRDDQKLRIAKNITPMQTRVVA